MSTSTAGVISKPVTHTDIANATGKSWASGLGNMITTGTINKWSIHKPTAYIYQKAEVTEAQMIAQQCSLSPVTLTYLKAMEYYYGAGGYTKADCEGQISEWPYTRPSSPYYRQLDFNGYDPNSLASDRGWTDITVDKADLSTVAAGTAQMDTSSTTVVVPTTHFHLVNYSAHLIINGSSVYIGSSGSSLQLPMNYAAYASGLLSNVWRMGVAVWFPYASRYLIFVSRYPFSVTSSSPVADYSVDLGTNQLACQDLYDHTSAGDELDCTPILVRNCAFLFNNNKSCAYFGTGSSDSVFCMPSGTISFKMKITSSGSLPTIGNMVVIASVLLQSGGTASGWYIGYVDTGSYASSYPLREILIACPSNQTPTTRTISGTITYQYGAGYSGTITISETANIANVVRINGVDYYGVAVNSGMQAPAITFSASDVSNLRAV